MNTIWLVVWDEPTEPLLQAWKKAEDYNEAIAIAFDQRAGDPYIFRNGERVA